MEPLSWFVELTVPPSFYFTWHDSIRQRLRSFGTCCFLASFNPKVLEQSVQHSATRNSGDWPPLVVALRLPVCKWLYREKRCAPCYLCTLSKDWVSVSDLQEPSSSVHCCSATSKGRFTCKTTQMKRRMALISNYLWIITLLLTAVLRVSVSS